ncbi:hypothetical protein BJ165DRAFT_1358081 [Panaeolus papilionaceus]|nr:hypothetical protein BJ165DRAFT_1358081 [Panaeolus papilionaceus]
MYNSSNDLSCSNHYSNDTAYRDDRHNGQPIPNHRDLQDTFYRRDTHGQFVPISNETRATSSCINDNTTNSGTPVGSSTPDWDGWPDGYFTRNFTQDEFNETGKLRTHWAMFVNGGDRKGQTSSSTWEGGKKATRRCLGVIECDDPVCKVLIRPYTKGHQQQLQEKCKCGGTLELRSCNVVSVLHTWAGGVHYSNGGYHLHRRPTHILHLLPDQENRFQELVRSHPKSGPLQLVVGVPGLHGPGKSAADISRVFLNAARVSKERQKVTNEIGPSADGFIASFSRFEDEHPGFVINSVIGKVTVISVQTEFMRSQLVKDSTLNGPINGMVNDAAHGWWRESNSLLMVTSTYCPQLHCWVPSVMSYTNGASTEHFTQHFQAVFQSISLEVKKRKRKLTDADFAGVMDFSQAEHAGFVSAFIMFWSTNPEDTRTRQELQIAAERLLKGCREHFRAQVSRVACITGVIPPSEKEGFTKRALALLDAPTSALFLSHASQLIDDFPKIKSWIDWWMRPSVASMLFESERKMDVELWDSLPASTNAEESMHWKLYSACGRNHAFLEGMYSLHAVAVYYERLFLAALEGAPIRYGDAEPWKVIAAHIGRTKKSRAPDPAEGKKRKRNDGRPPDTAKELLQVKKPRINSTKRSNTSKVEPDWLVVDTIMDGLSKDSAIKLVLEHFKYRLHLNLTDRSGAYSMEQDRNKIRTLLRKRKVISTIGEHEPLLSWFYQLLRLEDKPSTFRSIAAFEIHSINIHTCSGTPPTGGTHVQISRQQYRGRVHQLTREDYTIFSGDFDLYFNNLLSLERQPTAHSTCWRVKDGVSLCPGKHTSTGKLVLSMPLIYTFDIALDDDDNPPSWNFPEILNLTQDNPDLVYELLGLGFINDAHNHFIARYVSDGHGKKAVQSRARPCSTYGATIETHLAGENTHIPAGFVPYQVFYRLRGGLDAQSSYFNLRSDLISRKFNLGIAANGLSAPCSITYIDPTFIPMKVKDRTWIYNPFKANTLEYITKGARGRRPPSKLSISSVTSDSPESEEEVQYNLNSAACSIAPSDTSLPLSSFSLDCLCGVHGDGNLHYNPMVNGPAIQCDDCKGWSHIACQRNGRASNLSAKESFICDNCDPTHILPKRRASERKKIEARTGYKEPLTLRLRSGRGALARVGIYFYPVRLIQMVGDGWNVRWWRGNEYSSSVPGPPVETSFVSLTDLHDSLWRNRFERRQIRLGKWKHACEVPTSEDILSDPTSQCCPVPYTALTHEILSPFKDVLMKLTLNSASIDSSDIPAKAWLESNNLSLKDSPVPFVGHLSLVERAQISNWFDQHITAGDPKLRLSWLARLPIAHAFTIYIAHSLQPSGSTPVSQNEHSTELINEAWEIQMSGMPLRSIDIDVDRTCLHRLEEDMFEVSSRAEMAGYYQWGLDAGPHQDDWDPYLGLPDSWNLGDHQFDEELLQVS